MKHLLLTTIAAVVLVGCATTQSPEPPTAKAPDISINTAAEEGNIEAVKQHLAAGTDVNAEDDEGWTALVYAIVKDREKIVELLIANGADVNAKMSKGWTPLDIAIEFEHSEIADLLRKHGGKTGEEASIHEAAGRGNIETVKQHLAAGTDVNAKDAEGFTPLHYAATKEVAELLIAKGALVNAKGDGETPLDWAIEFKHTETADLLRKHGGKTRKELKAEGK